MANYRYTQIPSVRDPITYSKPPLPPVGYASWLTQSIAQPYFTPYDVNIFTKNNGESIPNVLRALDANNNYALQFNGIDNYLSLGTMGNFGSNLANGFYCKFHIKTTSTVKGNFGFVAASGTEVIQIGLNRKSDSSNISGNLSIVIEDNNSLQLAGGANSPTINFNDGNFHTIIFTANFSTNTLAISIDGFSQIITYGSQQALTTWVNFSRAFYIGARNNPGPAFAISCIIDNFKIGTSSSVLYGSYSFNEGTGITTADNSGQGNNGSFSTSYPVWVHGFSDAPFGVASWLALSISQPYIVPLDINSYLISPVNASTYFRAPPPPVGSAGWLPASVFQPYFTPFNENLYDWPADIGTYAKPPPAPNGFAGWGNNTISQPYFTPYDINNLGYPVNVGTYFKPVPPPKPEAEWLPTLIEQPYFTPYDVNNLIYPANISTYFKAPPAPQGIASLLAQSIAQPYFIPYDVNVYVWNPNAGNLRTLVTATIPASWFTNTIYQPYFPLIDINQYLNRIDPELYFKAPPPPQGVGSWLNQTISQPYIVPYNELLYGIQPVDIGTYFKRPPAPVGVASWLSSVVSEPYFTPYDVNWLVWPASPATYFKAPLPPPDEAGWLPSLIEQPYFPFIDINPYSTSTLPIGTYYKAPPAPFGVASWLKDTIEQPYFTPYDINWIVWNPNAGNLRPLQLSYATWAARNVSQPYFTLYDINNLGYPVNVALYFKAPPPPVDIASWLNLSIEQPYFPALDINLYLIKPVDVGTYFKSPPPPQGVGAWLVLSISQPYFPYIPIYLYNPPQVWAKTILYDWIKVPKSKDIWTKIPKTVTTHIE